MTDEVKAPAGWYPHPSMAATQRYWDGQAWTDHVAPATAGPATAPGATHVSTELRNWIGTLIIGGALALVGFLMSGEPAMEDAGNGLLALGGLVAVIAMFKIAADLMRSDPT